MTAVWIDPQYNRLKFPEVKEYGVTNGYLKKLKIFCDVPNLPETPIPAIDTVTTRSEAYMLQKQTEWHSPGFGVLLWSTKKDNPSSDPTVGDWNVVGYHSIINTGVWRQYDSYPIFSDNLTDELEEGDKIGISLESRWVNGVEYFARLTPPYVQPYNRPDRITFEAGWVQDLVIAKKDPQPMIIYFTSTNSSGGTTTTQPTAPVVSLNIGTTPISTTLYTVDKTAFTVDISSLTANGSFTYQWLLAGNPIGSPVTATADSQGKKSISFDSSLFASSPFSGTGVYAVRVTNGSLSTDSNSITVKHFSVTVSPSPIVVGSSNTWKAIIIDFKSGVGVTLTMMKNGVLLSGWSYPSSAPTYYSGSTPPSWRVESIPSTVFDQTGWGRDTNETYNLIVTTANGVSCTSPGFKANSAPSGGLG